MNVCRCIQAMHPPAGRVVTYIPQQFAKIMPPLIINASPECPGVKRVHLVDAKLDGGLILELYSRDGVGTMISTDFYEGGRSIMCIHSNTAV